MQAEPGSMRHLAGDRHPLYGIKNKVSKDAAPKFKMTPLYSVIALKIQNNTNGPIVVKNAEFTAPEEIVGSFAVNITGDEPTFSVSGAASKTAHIELNSAYQIEAGTENNYAILYLAVKPFDASNTDITIAINGVASKGNGASRTVKMPANTKFEAGKITTITVPVETLSFGSTETNLLSGCITDWGMKEEWGLVGSRWSQVRNSKIIELPSDSPLGIYVNGEKINTYAIGTESSAGVVIIRGTARELFPYLPIEFYATSWDDKKSVMRVNSIAAGFEILYRKTYIKFGWDDLTGGDDPLIADVSKLKFDGLMPLDQIKYDSNNYAIILDEEPYHKKIGKDQIDKLLLNFDDNKNDRYTPTFEGLNVAITTPASITKGEYTLTENSSAADVTAKILYDKIYNKLSGNQLVSGVFSWILGDSPRDFFDKVGSIPIEVQLITISKDAKEGATDNRVLVWGLNSSYANK